MVAQFTPGPWSYTKAAVTGDRGIYVEGIPGIFAEAFADIRHAGENNATEALANARLIAAAPDLLALVELVHGSFGGGRVITFSDEDIAAFAAAIAKARTP